ncbi:alpha/beta fold hydrolase [candidate division WOR-3 bacterium]|nr:alpha/beta fold hydrolase [candidate division WOR-3 bacterium]
MKRLLPFFCIMLLACGALACGGGKKGYEVTAEPEPILGEWEGAVTIGEIKLGMTVTFTMEGDTLRAFMDIPEQGASDLPLEGIQYDGSKVYFELAASIGRAYYDGKLEEERISGTFKQGIARGEFYLERPEPEVYPYPTEEVSIKVSDELTLGGTLSTPEGTGPFPAVILITGSGPQDRDENIFGFKIFKMIADHLTRNGIAVLRSDDRGVGESVFTGDARKVTTADFTKDAEAQFRFLEGRSGIDKRKIGILGHSEGAIVAVMAAAQNPNVAFIITMAGEAVPGDELLPEQLELTMKAEGKSAEEIAEQLEMQKKTLQAARSQEGFDEVEAAVKAIIEDEVDKLPRAQRKALGDKDAHVAKVTEAQMEMVKSAWFEFFVTYDPRTDLAKVKCPVLALFGAKDVQVPAASQSKALEETFSKAGKTNYRIKVFTDANHLFQKAETGGVSEYAKLAKEFHPGFLDTVSAWILGL